MRTNERTREYFYKLRKAFFPQRCLMCARVIAPDKKLCTDCSAQGCEILPPLCSLCGRGKNQCRCAPAGKARSYLTVCAPFYYTGPMKKCIHRFKFQGKVSLAGPLAFEIAAAVRRSCPDTVFDVAVPVPMGTKRRKKRGYNQSELLTKELSLLLGIPCDSALLHKLYDVVEQHGLSALRRSGNVFGVYDVAPGKDVDGKTVLLCDDVLTTGATVNECAKMLLLHGARSVVCAVAAVAV